MAVSNTRPTARSEALWESAQRALAGGVNSPATIAGCMASMNAGILLGVVLSQLVQPGAPIAVPGWNGGPYNLKTMVGNYVLADEQGVPTRTVYVLRTQSSPAMVAVGRVDALELPTAVLAPPELHVEDVDGVGDGYAHVR